MDDDLKLAFVVLLVVLVVTVGLVTTIGLSQLYYYHKTVVFVGGGYTQETLPGACGPRWVLQEPAKQPK